ncbi:unnamed protein product, partial [Mesorhabditis belari]|uniref:Uncharacterized protein n=1 Tax=Mesorhabditis belari TaxID=2138241 RepID=A0AAF3EAZ7_9BILA
MTTSNIELGLIITSSRNNYYLPWKTNVPELVTTEVPRDCYQNWVVRIQEPGSIEKYLYPLEASKKAPLIHRHRNNRVLLRNCWLEKDGSIATEDSIMAWPITDPQGYLQPPDFNRRYTLWGRVGFMEESRDISIKVVEIVESWSRSSQKMFSPTSIGYRLTFPEDYKANQEMCYLLTEQKGTNGRKEKTSGTLILKILQELLTEEVTREAILEFEPAIFDQLLKLFDMREF